MTTVISIEKNRLNIRDFGVQNHHELKATKNCAFPYDSKQQKDVCINPYHYDRVETPLLPPVLVPRSANQFGGIPQYSMLHQNAAARRPPPQVSQSCPMPGYGSQQAAPRNPPFPSPGGGGYPNSAYSPPGSRPTSGPGSPVPQPINFGNQVSNYNPSNVPNGAYPVRSPGNNLPNGNFPIRSPGPPTQNGAFPVRSPGPNVQNGNFPVRSPGPNVSNGNFPVRSQSSIPGNPALNRSPAETPNTYYQQQFARFPSQTTFPPSSPASSGPPLSPLRPSKGAAMLNSTMESIPDSPPPSSPGSDDSFSAHSPKYDTKFDPHRRDRNMTPPDLSNALCHPDIQPVHYSEPKCWCQISYYELNNRVGAPFDCESPAVTVDGFTDPSNSANRFCLGLLMRVQNFVIFDIFCILRTFYGLLNRFYSI